MRNFRSPHNQTFHGYTSSRPHTRTRRGTYFIFALSYNAICVDCSGLQNPYWVMQHCMGTANFWLVCILTAVLGVIPRLCGRVLQCTIWPNSVTKAMILRKNVMKTQPQARPTSKNTPNTIRSRENSSIAIASSRSNSVSSSRNRGGSQDTEMTAINP